MPGFVDTNGSLKEYVNVSTNTKIPDLPKGWTAGIEPYWNAVWTATANPLSIGNADDDANEKGELHNGKLVTRQITGVAAGTALTDAVNVAQLEYAIAQFSQGGGGTGGSDIHFYSVNEKSDQRGNYDNKGATGTDALAAGVDAQATGNYSVAVGNGANAPADGAVAIGEGSIATRGKGNKEGTVSIDQTTGKTTITNYGNEKTAYLKPDNLSTDSTTWVSTAGAVSVGGTTEYKEKNDNGEFVTKTNLLTRQITNVAAGSDDTDAVNVAQLKAALRQTGTGTIHDYSVNSANTTTDTNYNYDADTGSNALAAGVSAKATGARSVAVGNGAKAQEIDSIAIGTNAVATGIGAMVIGQYNTAEGQNSLAFGGGYNKANKGNKASSTAAVAFGEGSWAVSEGSVAFGYGTQAGNIEIDPKTQKQKFVGQNAVAFGNGTKALGGRSLAFGENTTANFNDSVAFGNGATAFSSGATAFGNRSRALSQYATSFGDNSVAAGSMSFAFGTDSIAGAALDDNGALELTDGSRMDSYGNKAYTTTDAGGNKTTYSIKGMKPFSGNDPHDYVVVTGTKADGTTGTYVEDYQGGIVEVKVNADGTVTKVKDLYSGKYGGWYQYDEQGNIIQTGTGKNKKPAVVSSDTLKAQNKPIPVILDKATPGSNGYTLKGFKNATAFGYSTEASGDYATAFGNDTQAKATGATAFGNKSQATGRYATAWGGSSTASGEASTAFGIGSTASGKNSLAVGGAEATLEDSIALGKNSKTTRAKYSELTSDAEAYGKTSTDKGKSAWEATENAIAVGNDSTTTRQITGVAAGSLDTDAVNVAQLKRLNENLSGQHTIVTVGNRSVSADNTPVTGGNLDLTRKTATNGQATYDLSLDRHVTLGEQAENKGGSLTVNNVDAFKNYDEKGNRLDDSIIKEAVKIDGKTVSIVKRDGTDGENDQRQVVLGVGQDTGGYVTLYDSTGKKPTYIYNAISPGITYLKDKDSYSKPDEFGRLEYKISNDSPQFIATLDDGQKYAGDNYLAADIETTDSKTTVKKEEQNVITKKLNERLDIQGGAAKDKLTKNNIGVNVVDGVLKVQLAQKIDLTKDGSVTMGDTTINNGGVTITPKNGDKVILTDAGLNNGNNKIINVADGVNGTDAVNMSQLNNTNHTIKYYSVNDKKVSEKLPTEFKAYSNEGNNGANGMGSIAAGFVTHADGIASTVAGSYSGVLNSGDVKLLGYDLRGATALSYGTLNVNKNDEKSSMFSGVANSIIGQANATTNSNAAIIYGAGNTVKNSYRDIDVNKFNLNQIISDLSNPEELAKDLRDAVPTSGGQVMVLGGGNSVDNAYMTQVNGVGNTVKGSGTKYGDDSTQLNYIEGFYTNLTNGKNDYIIGAHNNVTGNSVADNQSNIVFGDNHTLENRSNNIIIGSADTENKATEASNAVIIGHNANASVDNGVAIGAESVANMGVPTTAGYDPSGATHKSTDAAWTATKAAVSVGNATKGSNGEFTGTTRQITNVAAGAEDTDAVNVAQLKQLKSVVDSVSGKHTLVTVNGGKQAPEDTIPNNDKYSQYTSSSDGNLQLAQKVNDGQITYDLKLSDDLNVGKAGTNGKDGVDGKIGVNGKDGASVVINGKDGSIGLTGPKGADGKDGASLTMRAEKGDPGVNGKDGITRIVYDGQQVATLDDGLKFGGDFGDVSKVKLNKQVNVKGNATNEKDLVDGNIGVVSRQDGENGQLLIKLNKNINLGNDGSITINNVKVNNEGLKITNSTTDDTKNVVINGNTISMGGNKITNVARGEAGTDAVNVSQLTEVKQLASKHTLVTVNGGKQAPEDTVPNNDKYSQYTSSSDGNLQLAQKVNDGQITYDVKLNEKLDLTDKGSVTTGNTVMNNDGVKVDDGNGNSTAVTTGGVTVQDSNGNTTKVEAGKISVGNGTNNVTINGDSGTVNGLTNKTWDGEHYVSGQGATEDQLHQVESNVNKKFDDVNKRIENVDKHHTEVTVNGGTSAPTTENTYSEGNLQIAQKTGANGQKVYDLKLNDNLNIGSVGKAGKDGKDGHIGINGKDGKSSVGIDGKDGISVIGADGKNGVSIIGSNDLNGKDGIDGKIAIGTPGKDAISISGQNGEGHIGLTGAAGKDGKNATADIHVKNGQVGVDGTDGRGGKDGMDRVVYEDHNGTPHEVATMDDGMKYGDDFGNTAKVKLNHQLDIVGDINAGKKDGDKKATKDDLSDGNIGIIATDTTYNKDGTVKENGKMTVKLAKDLKGLNSIESNSVTTGNTTINNGGLTIKTEDANRTITVQDGNVNMGGNQIHNVAPGQAPGDAVNVSQLNATNSAVNKLGNRINRVGAGAAALAALHPLDFDPDDKWDFAAGYGNYRGANAAAIGAYYRPNEDTMFSVGGSFGGGENMVNAGVSFKLGQGNHVSTSRVAMAKEIKDLRQDVANLNAIVNRQSALIDKLTGTNAGTVSDTGNDLFPDVPANHWAYEYVTKLKQAGILTGYPDGNFDGDRMMTRYEFAAIVYRAIMAGAASNPALNQDGTLDKLAKEFSPEMKYIRIDTIAKDKNDKPTIERVRVIPDAK